MMSEDVMIRHFGMMLNSRKRKITYKTSQVNKYVETLKLLHYIMYTPTFGNNREKTIAVTPQN